MSSKESSHWQFHLDQIEQEGISTKAYAAREGGLHLPEFPDRDFLALVARCCAENSRTGNIACLLH